MATNPSITFGGLASGLDTNAIIDGLLKVEALPLQRNQATQQTVTAARSTLSSLLNSLNAVKTAAEALDTASEFAAYKVESSDKSILSAAANGSPAAGVYNVKVNSLAQVTRAKSPVQTSATSQVGVNGNLQITVGGVTTPVQISNSDSITTIAANINATSAAVTASVVTDNTGSYLLVVGQSPGAANQVTFDGTGQVKTQFAMTTYQNAADAEIVVDDQFTFSNTTNTFSNAIEGLTLTAKKVDATGTSVEVASDADAQASKISSFIDAYNNAVSAGHLAAGWGSIKASNSRLAGDSAVRSSLDLLARTVTSPVPGLTGKYQQLASVGVRLAQDGSMQLDKTKLKAALASDPKSVAELFVGDSDAGADGAMKLVSNAVKRITTSKTGILSLRIGQLDSEVTRLQDDEEALQRRLDSFEANLRQRFTALEEAISKIQHQSRGLSSLTSFSTSNNS